MTFVIERDASDESSISKRGRITPEEDQRQLRMSVEAVGGAGEGVKQLRVTLLNGASAPGEGVVPLALLQRRVRYIQSQWQVRWQAGSSVARIVDWLAREALPSRVMDDLRAWALSSDAPKVLCVCAPWEEEAILWMPWESIPVALGRTDLLVARVRSAEQPAPARASEPRGALLVTWSGLGDAAYPGVAREMGRLPEILKAAGVEAEVLSQPTDEGLAAKMKDDPFAILHVATSSFTQRASLLHALRDGSAPPRFVFLNTCQSGYAAAREICHHFGAAVLGWAGVVLDDAAFDFACYFYNRLGEHETIAGAVRSFLDNTAASPAVRFASQPIVWLRDAPAATEALFPRRAGGVPHRTPRGIGAPRAQSFSEVVQVPGMPESPSMNELSGGPFQIELELQDPMCPGLLKNGWPPIKRLSLNPPAAYASVVLHVECDTGRGKSSFRKTLSLKKGEQPIDVSGIWFPALAELSDQGSSRRHLVFFASVSLPDGRTLAETTATTLWLRRNDWIDRESTWAFLPAFVQSSDEGVLDILDHAMIVLRQVGTVKDKFNGYETTNREGVKVLVKALFLTLRDEPFSLRYISPPPIGLYEVDSRQHLGQAIRFPQEVIARKRGTCLDLALLLAAAIEHVGINPLIVLLPDHAFVGYWRSRKAFNDYWEAQRALARGAGEADTPWLITDPTAFKALVEKEVPDIGVIEATAVAQDGSFEDAEIMAKSRLADLQGVDDWNRRRFHAAVDVRAARYKVQPV